MQYSRSTNFSSSRFEILMFTFDVCSFQTERFLMWSAQLLTLSERRATKETMFIVHTVPGDLRRKLFGIKAALCWEKKYIISRFSQLNNIQTSTSPDENKAISFIDSIPTPLPPVCNIYIYIEYRWHCVRHASSVRRGTQAPDILVGGRFTHPTQTCALSTMV